MRRRASGRRGPRDDAGRPIRLVGVERIGRACENAERGERLRKRAERVLAYRAFEPKSRAGCAMVALLSVLFTAVFAATIGLLERVVPGKLSAVPAHTLGLLAVVLCIWVLMMRRARRVNRTLIRLVLAEGVCPGCGYNFAGLRRGGPGDRLVCPECGAVWAWRRVAGGATVSE